MQITMDPGRWLVTPRPRPAAPVRLLCLPFAGGAASAYRAWPELMGEDVEVSAVQLPGREMRLREPPFDRVEPLVAALADVLDPTLDRPYAVFGHSMGALIGFELARELRRRGRPLPVALVASGRNAPHLPARDPLMHPLPEPEFLERLRTFEGTPEAVLEHQELMQLLIPLLRADFAVNEAYTHREEAPLDLPLLAMGGDADPEVSREGLEAWSGYTTGPFTLEVYPGGHFFLNPLAREVTRAVRGVVARAARLPA
ncbi:MAG TPA: alpha/beta fold hydrolase [Longimicrobiaceae bacterium]|nr:alpha/beta fold hydrolase [Longimicrobiaceae bacterium]